MQIKQPTLVTPIIIPTSEEIRQQPKTISLKKSKKRKFDFSFDFNIKPSATESNYEKNTKTLSPISPISPISPLRQSFKKIKIDHPNMELPKK